jgi:2-oxoglutarate dehydrogenase E1 component
VPAEWQAFFADLQDKPDDVRKNARGASWKRQLADARQWRAGLGARRQLGRRSKRPMSSGDARFGARHHDDPRLSACAATCTPISIRWAGPAPTTYNELIPEAYGFTEADYDRPIFIDNVLGLEYATIREISTS